MPKIEVAVAEPAQLGECPLWAPSEGVLYWIDIDGRTVHRYDPSSGVDRSCEVPGRPGSIALTDTAHQLLMAIEHELVWLDWETGKVASWVQLETPAVGVRLNDGRTDPAGRMVVGSMYEDPTAGRRDGTLHRIDPDGSVEVLRRDIGVTNGLGFDPARGVMYFADSPTGRVLAWDYDLPTGSLGTERLFLDFDAMALPGLPDGACVDTDGCYWSAAVYGSAVVRVTPDGRIDRRIELPVQRPSMPAFGGPALDTLFVTSIGSSGHGSAEPADSGVAQGALLAIDVSTIGVTGLQDTPFAGSRPRQG